MVENFLYTTKTTSWADHNSVGIFQIGHVATAKVLLKELFLVVGHMRLLVFYFPWKDVYNTG